MTSEAAPKVANPRVFFDISIGGVPQGRIVMELFADTTPKTAGALGICFSCSVCFIATLQRTSELSALERRAKERVARRCISREVPSIASSKVSRPISAFAHNVCCQRVFSDCVALRACCCQRAQVN